MIYRYKSSAGKFADIDLAETDRQRVDIAMRARGFVLVAKSPQDKVDTIPFAEFVTLIGGEARSKPLVGPQPGGSIGPVGFARARAGGAVAVRL